MTLDPSIKAMLRQPIYVAPALARTEYGDAQYGDPTARRAWVQRRNSIVHTPDGGELLSDVQIIAAEPIGISDRVWLPGTNPQDERQARAPKAVAPIADEDGKVSHYEVSL